MSVSHTTLSTSRAENLCPCSQHRDLLSSSLDYGLEQLLIRTQKRESPGIRDFKVKERTELGKEKLLLKPKYKSNSQLRNTVPAIF